MPSSRNACPPILAAPSAAAFRPYEFAPCHCGNSAARIADELFDRLDAPVRRVGALDTWVGYHPRLESAILPQTETLSAEIERLLGY